MSSDLAGHMTILVVSRILDSLTRRTFGTLDLPVSLSLSLFFLFIWFILGLWVSRMARRLLFQRPFDAS
jgi:hypothetical protein